MLFVFTGSVLQLGCSRCHPVRWRQVLWQARAFKAKIKSCSGEPCLSAGRGGTVAPKRKRKHHPHPPVTLWVRLVVTQGGVDRPASAWASLLGAEGSGAQSSLSDRVSYCSDSRDCHTRCWATGPPVGGGGCCWLCIDGDAMEVGGAVLIMRMVSGL